MAKKRDKLEYPYNLVADIISVGDDPKNKPKTYNGLIDYMKCKVPDFEEFPDNIEWICNSLIKSELNHSMFYHNALCKKYIDGSSFASIAREFNASNKWVTDAIKNSLKRMSMSDMWPYGTEPMDSIKRVFKDDTRIKNCLLRQGLKTIGEVKDYVNTNQLKTIEDLCKNIRNLGNKSAAIMNERLELGLYDSSNISILLDRENECLIDLLNKAEKFIDNYARNNTTEDEMKQSINDLYEASKLLLK